jgi:hypothetical protein
MFDSAYALDFDVETAFIAVGIVDSALARGAVSIDQFQVLGAAALLVASKLEENERSSERARQLVHAGDGAYTKAQLFDREIQIVTDMTRHFPATTTATVLKFVCCAAGLSASDADACFCAASLALHHCPDGSDSGPASAALGAVHAALSSLSRCGSGGSVAAESAASVAAAASPFDSATTTTAAATSVAIASRQRSCPCRSCRVVRDIISNDMAIRCGEEIKVAIRRVFGRGGTYDGSYSLDAVKAHFSKSCGAFEAELIQIAPQPPKCQCLAQM